RRAISEVVPDVPINVITLLSDQVANSLNQERLIAWLTSIFGVLALGLASLGLFGVMSYAVTQRTAEFGIRLALGASRTRVLSGSAWRREWPAFLPSHGYWRRCCLVSAEPISRRSVPRWRC